MNGEPPLLDVSSLSTSFSTPRGLLRAVDGVSFSIRDGETLGIVGESGSGKSVLVRSVMGLLGRSATVDPASRASFAGRDLLALDPISATRFWGREMAMVFQDPLTSLNPVRRIGHQIAEPLRRHLRLGRAETRRRSLELLDMVGIPDPQRRLDEYPHQLSGGMRQRVTIAIAISCQPRLLIADEPTTALDVTVQKQILDLLADVQAELGMAMILITHDLGVVASYADRVAVMYAGRMVEVADTIPVFDRTAHPYTEALLGSIPRMDGHQGGRLDAISGRPPDMTDPPPGCSFAPRCRLAQPDCLETEPTLVPLGGLDHFHACHHPVGTDEGERARVRNREAGRTAAGLELHEGSSL
ncbi:MAG: ABC transporter ATP-binding protein [Acidimicrobiales bacterium]|nr:ABC transporter ATP-binding protein [Acidimicrobiales bacterium]